MKKKLTASLLVGLTLFALGCAKKISIHPGAISNFDSYAYDVLLVEQDVLNQAKADFASGALPASSKGVINGAITQYNTTQDLWQTYHATGAGADKLDQALALLVTLIGDIQKMRGKSATPITAGGSTWPAQLEPVYGGAL